MTFFAFWPYDESKTENDKEDESYTSGPTPEPHSVKPLFILKGLEMSLEAYWFSIP
jgi:hypothetical protein